MLNKLRSVFFSVMPARRALAEVRAPHYLPTAPFSGSRPSPLQDLPADRVEQINQKSDDYFDNPGQHPFWVNKPLSDPHYGPENLWRFGLLLSALRIRREDRVLDFGCGTGWTSVLMARTGAEVTGMDISEKALAVARDGTALGLAAEDRARLRFQNFNGRTIDAPDGHFDFVIVLDALHHLPNPVAVLEECCRVLGPHGYLGFAEPGKGHSHTHTSRDELALGVLENEIDPEQLRSAALGAGFAELELIVPPIPPSLLTLTMPRARWFLRGLPWIVPHDYIRATMLSSPIGILRKGPHISTSLHPHTLDAAIRPATFALTAAPGQRFTVTAEVENTTGTVWLKEGRRGSGYVRLGAHLLRPADHATVAECGRADLPGDLQQHGRCVLELACTAPVEPGEYIIRLDMVDEGIAWFSERGSKPADVRLLVRN